LALKTKHCKHGTFTFFDNDRYIGGALDHTGEYSEQEVQALLTIVPSDAVVIEVGSNIGAITVPLAKRVAKVIAFEPQPVICVLLRRNVAQNGLDAKVSIFESAVGAARATSGLLPIDYDAPGINTGGVALVSDGKVPVIPLDEVCQGLSRLDLIKIDVEGMERDVLVGAQHLINRFRPLLYVENDRVEKSAALIRYIMDIGYRLFWHHPQLFNPDPTSKIRFVSINMLCVPKERPIETDFVEILSEDDDWELKQHRERQQKHSKCL